MLAQPQFDKKAFQQKVISVECRMNCRSVRLVETRMVGLETMVKARDKHRYVPTDQGCAQREVPLLCFILMIQWEASRGQVVRSLPRSWPIKTPGRAAGQPGMIYDAIIGEIARSKVSLGRAHLFKYVAFRGLLGKATKLDGVAQLITD